MKRILGISAYYHDSAAALIINGEIIAAAQEERFTRKKHDASFPTHSIQYCLDHAGLSVEQLDAIVFYDKPLLKFERLLESYYAFAPKGILSFITSMPVWVKEKMFLKKLIKDELERTTTTAIKDIPLLFPEHHLSHAASAFYPSNFKEAAILTIDGVGEWATASICHGKDKEIKVLKELKFPHSLGLLYSAFTYFLGFKVNSGEYKLMGLAPYGNDGEQTAHFEKIIKEKLIKIYDDGSIWLDQKYFKYGTGLRMVSDKKWEQLFGIKRRVPESSLEQIHCDLAFAIQKVTEEIVIKMTAEAKKLTNADHLCLAGGVALNCVSNGKLQNSELFEHIFIQPAAGDAGGAIGGALAAYHIKFGQERVFSKGADLMKGAYLGPDFSKRDIQKLINGFDAKCTAIDDMESLSDQTAELLEKGMVVGWMQGRMEFGPRALGNRSILGDPRNAEMQKKLNLKIKYRESFRPFAPAVLAEDVQGHFQLKSPSPYMLYVQPIIDQIRRTKPDGFDELDIKEKLYFERSSVPAITHIDYSARIQTVHSETNPRFHHLLQSFKKRTGIGMLINTSFNVRGEPIVCTPEDAYRCFMRTEMDYLVIGNYLFDKKEQPAFNEESNFKREFKLD